LGYAQRRALAHTLRNTEIRVNKFLELTQRMG